MSAALEWTEQSGETWNLGAFISAHKTGTGHNAHAQLQKAGHDDVKSIMLTYGEYNLHASFHSFELWWGPDKADCWWTVDT